MKKRGGRIITVLLAGMVWVFWGVSAAAGESSPWYQVEEPRQVTVDFYFFWSPQCPHCRKAKPFVEELTAAHSWIRLHSLNVQGNPENGRRFVELAREVNQTSFAIPTFMFCGTSTIGYRSRDTTGVDLLKSLARCRAQILNQVRQGQPVTFSELEEKSVSLPFFGKVDPARYSLPVFTLLLAGVDAFNPCAFFVLLFLLSLLVHARSRMRMFLIGGIFVFVSGLAYFVFMAAWLNVFLMVGELRWVTFLAGLFAIFIAVVNIKDYFFFQKGFSLTLSDSVKPNLYHRVLGLLKSDSTVYLTVGTVCLAIAANAYELLCTAGFPMVFTRVLTLNDLSVAQYYFYLVFYNLVYVMPLLVIVLLFTWTLGSRKMSVEEGRVLKLLSGLMMLFLGLLILYAPELLSNLLTAVGLVGGAVLATLAIVGLDRLRKKWV